MMERGRRDKSLNDGLGMTLFSVLCKWAFTTIPSASLIGNNLRSAGH